MQKRFASGQEVKFLGQTTGNCVWCVCGRGGGGSVNVFFPVNFWCYYDNTDLCCLAVALHRFILFL